ncbi:hypothetical protein [Actinomadura mexicana]|uniref:Threonine/homoserine efflux transporter RhtA n=1 Tax=Actinomadura mexicana TaxID=134959 RepID=A0A239BH77_9ACTN|nr:hypothetical protein [Actinomadura mexicana]SNS06383.1 Threonine/homoserine efflux transporter RhtA [Actinomadura mexicana]
MSFSLDLRRRLAGRAFLVASLLSAGIGYAFTTGFSALEVAAPMQAAGAIGLCALMLFTGRSPFRRYQRPMWRLIGRLAGGNAVVAVLYPFAVRRLTLGTVAAVVVLGYLSVGFKKVWHMRTTAWGLQHMCGRLLVLGGIIMLNWPLQGEIVGLLCALVSAACVWNTITVLGKMKHHGLEDQGAAIANLLSAPLLFAAVFLLRGGVHWMSSDLVSWGALAGLLTLMLPVLLTNAALRRISELDVGVMQSLSTPVHAMVALVGAALGWLASDQRLAFFPGWAAILLIAGAAVGVSSLKEPSADVLRVGTQPSGG